MYIMSSLLIVSCLIAKKLSALFTSIFPMHGGMVNSQKVIARILQESYKPRYSVQ